jgi:tripartite-type tricarboxylate transporter receptor subunit TctC
MSVCLSKGDLTMQFRRLGHERSNGVRVRRLNGLSLFSFFCFMLLCLSTRSSAQEPFYRGKTIRIIVGTGAGGGYDLYSRALARHFGKQIPGNPVVIVDNMTGAGGLIASNHVYKVAKPDGLTIGHIVGSVFLQQLIGKPGIEFDARKFGFIGAPAQDTQLLTVHRRTGIKTLEQWLASKTMVKFGASGLGSANEDIPKIVKEVLGLPLQIVSGYKGSAEIRLAINSGEVDGISIPWESLKGTWQNEMEAGDIMVVLQAAGKSHRELANVPLAMDFAKNDVARKLLQAGVNNYGATARPYILPPGTPNERVEILRRAFTETLNDADFAAELKKAKLELNPLNGATLERNVKEIFDLDPGLVAKLAEILK